MHRNYELSALKELRDQQVRYSPRERKIEQSLHAERLYRMIDPEHEYSYEFVCFGITEFKTEMYPNLKMSGKKIRHDLLLFIEDLYDSSMVNVDEIKEKVWSIEELSERFNVSGKTISRWRKRGLIARRFLFGKKKRVGFLQESVDFFLQTNADQVKRGEKFSQLTPEEKRTIIQTARRLAGASLSATEVAKRLARYTGRSVETIRYTLKTFDEENRDIPLFPNRNTPLTQETRDNIYRAYRHGASIEQLARNYHRTRGSIYRVISQIRAQRIEQFDLSFIDNIEFHHVSPSQEKILLGLTAPSLPTDPVKTKTAGDSPVFEEVAEPAAGETLNTPHDAPAPTPLSVLHPKDEATLPPYLSGLYKIPLLTAEQERHLFRRLNYVKFKASKLREKHDPNRPKASVMSQIEKLYDQAVVTKNEIVSANLRLVVAIAKRHIGPYSNFFELISDGNLSLIRAVEKFDYGRGNRFSTYATWAVTRNYARTIPDEKKHHDRFHASEDSFFDSTMDNRSDIQAEVRSHLERQQQIGHLLSGLDEREQKIIVSRFGIGNVEEPLTLNEVGVEMGVTKERVRQIETRALAKLRQIAEEENLDIPGL